MCMNRSKLYQISDVDFLDMVVSSRNYSELFSKCNMDQRGSNRKTIIRRMEGMGIDYSHLKSNLGKTFEWRRYSLKDAMDKVFVCPSKIKTGTVKKLLLRHRLLPYKCKCGIENEWRGIEISLQLEHKNGNHLDNRVENLEFLCPNCHSQTKTFAGKSAYKHRNAADYKKYNRPGFKKDCEVLSAKEVKKKYNLTQSVLRRICNLVGIVPPKQYRAAQKIKWTEATLSELTDDVKRTSLRSLKKKYGVSANRLKEVCQKHRIDVPKKKI